MGLRVGARWAAAAAALFLLGFAAIVLNAKQLSFLGDDTWLILRAERGYVFGDYSGYGTEFFRPISSVALWLSHGLFGSAPAGYHVAAVVLHVLNAVLVSLLGMQVVDLAARLNPGRLSRCPSVPVGVIAGILFLVHPSMGEAVYWIAAQPDRLATFFSLLAFIALLRSFEGSKAWRIVSAASVAFALFSKESAVGALAALVTTSIVVDAWLSTPTTRPSLFRRVLHSAAPYLVVGGAYFLVRWSTLDTLVGGYGSEAYLGGFPVRQLGNASSVALRTVMPSMPLPAWIAVGGLGGVALVSTARHLAREPSRWRVSRAMLRSGWLPAACFVLLVAPVAALGASLTGPEGERCSYLPSVLSCIAIAWLGVSAATRTGPSRRLAWLASLLAVMVLAGVSLREGHRWRDASEATDKLTASIGEMESQHLLVLNAPDTVRGAVAFRNSAVGIGVYGGRYEDMEVQVVTARRFAEPQEADVARVRNRTGTGLLIEVSIEDPGVDGGLRSDYVDSGSWTVERTGTESYEVALEGLEQSTTVAMFAEGAIVELHAG